MVSFCLTTSVFVLPSFLKDSLMGGTILGLKLFSAPPLKRSLSYASTDAVETLVSFLFNCVSVSFLSVAFIIFFLSLKVSSFSMVYLGMPFSMFTLLTSTKMLESDE